MHSVHPVQPCETSQRQPARSLWRNLNFLLLSSGQMISILGSRLSSFALPFLMLILTHSFAFTGFLLALDMLPWMLFSLPLGALLDRWNRKITMILCDVIRLFALGSVPVAFFLGHLGVLQLCFVVFINGSATVCFELAQLAALPNVVHPRHLAHAYAITEITTASSKLIAPPLSGLLIGLARTRVVGAALAYLIDSITYLVSALTLCFLRVPFQGTREAQAQHHLWHDILEGVRLLWHQPLLLLLVLLTATVNFLMAPLTLSILAKATTLHATPAVIGVIFGIAGVGGILGGIIAPSISKRVRFGHIVLCSVLLWAVACSLLASASALPVLTAGAALIDFLWPIYNVVVVTYRLSLVPDHMQGRLNSSFRFVSYGCEALGTALGGVLLGSLGETSSLWLICAGLILCVLVSWSTQLRTA